MAMLCGCTSVRRCSRHTQMVGELARRYGGFPKRDAGRPGLLESEDAMNDTLKDEAPGLGASAQADGDNGGGQQDPPAPETPTEGDETEQK